MSPGDRPDLPLTTEPATVLRAATVGRPAPGPVQPVDHDLGLGEEPALRFEVLGSPRDTGGTGATSGHDRAGTTTPSDPALPATGPRLPVSVALGSIGLTWLLRRRAPHPD